VLRSPIESATQSGHSQNESLGNNWRSLGTSQN
jgi:hypothetical protein